MRRKVCLGPENVDVVELHDCFSYNELITYEVLGLCPEVRAANFSTMALTLMATRWS
jgi:sterol carrier protein 2